MDKAKKVEMANAMGPPPGVKAKPKKRVKEGPGPSKSLEPRIPPRPVKEVGTEKEGSPAKTPRKEASSLTQADLAFRKVTKQEVEQARPELLLPTPLQPKAKSSPSVRDLAKKKM